MSDNNPQNAQNVLDDRHYKLKPPIIANVSRPAKYKDGFANAIEQCIREKYSATMHLIDKIFGEEQIDELFVRFASSFSAPHLGIVISLKPEKLKIASILECPLEDFVPWSTYLHSNAFTIALLGQPSPDIEQHLVLNKFFRKVPRKYV